jgi:hypothetical protein
MKRELLTIAMALPLMAQTPPPEPTPPAPTPSFWTRRGVNISGVIDGYYAYNTNDPGSRTNSLRAFDTQANMPSLSMAKLTLDYDPGPIGFHVDIAAGRLGRNFHLTEQDLGNGAARLFPQAYVSLKPKSWNGVQVDVGKFYTSAGAEVTETHLNWNYSRSLLYAFGPYYHMGARITAPVNKVWTSGFQIINGWNNVNDLNSGKSFGVTNSFNFGKVAVNNVYYAGPEKLNTNRGWRHYNDTVVSVQAREKINLLFNYDFGMDRGVAGTRGSQFQGFAGAVKFQLNKHWAFSPRIEWFSDRDGLMTGTSQNLHEVTLTGEYKPLDWMLSRLEFRRDASDKPYFGKGPANAGVTSQNTLIAGIVVFFGPKK